MYPKSSSAAICGDPAISASFRASFRSIRAETGVRVDFEHAGLERRFRPEVETAAYLSLIHI